ncbi:unnamed protein product, partial [Tuber aestivum]
TSASRSKSGQVPSDDFLLRRLTGARISYRHLLSLSVLSQDSSPEERRLPHDSHRKCSHVQYRQKPRATNNPAAGVDVSDVPRPSDRLPRPFPSSSLTYRTCTATV